MWAEPTAVNSYMRGVDSTYRLCAVRIACAFRTISDDAVLGIAGQTPLGELVREAKEIRSTALINQVPMANAEAGYRAQMAGSMGHLDQRTVDPQAYTLHRVVGKPHAWPGRFLPNTCAKWARLLPKLPTEDGCISCLSVTGSSTSGSC